MNLLFMSENSKKAKLFLVIIIMLSCIAAISCGTGKDTAGNGVSEENNNETESEIPKVTTIDDIPWGEPKFPEYVKQKEYLEDPVFYNGTTHVVIGKNGCLYENGYINELYGFAQKYVNTTDEQLWDRTFKLKFIQDKLEEMDIAFCVVITPSKAADYEEYIPDFYLKDRVKPEDYVRPYIRFKDMMEKEGVYYVDSQTVYKKVGLTNTFPKTGIHWNKLAAFETINAIVDEYIRQTGKEAKHLLADEIIAKTNPPGFGNPERDIFGIVYGDQKKDIKETAILDDLYYWPDVYEDKSTNRKIQNMVIQGGSFTGDFFHYFGSYGIADGITGFYYNNGGNMDIDWKSVIRRTEFVLMEVNEQFIYGMGGNAPAWAEADLQPANTGNNIIDSLYKYLGGD